MNWIPAVLFTFKILVLATGMFFAIKWHYDKGQKQRKIEKPEMIRTAIKITVIFLLSLVILLLVTFFIANQLGLDLNF